MTSLFNLPVGLIILLPALLAAGSVAILTRDKKLSLTAGLVFLLVGLVAHGFHLYENYLNQHFIGTFDEQGIPSHITGAGWDLFLAAWPLWSFPMLWSVLIIALVLAVRYFNPIKPPTTPPAPPATAVPLAPEPTTETSPDSDASARVVQLQLEVEQLKKQLIAAKKKYETARENQLRTNNDMRKLRTKIKELQTDLTNYQEAQQAKEGEQQPPSREIPKAVDEQSESALEDLIDMEKLWGEPDDRQD